MAVELVMPKLAMAMQQGTIIEWTIQEGTRVERGEIVLIIETEKVTYECESPADGFIHILVAPGTTVSVYEKLALIAENETELTELQQDEGPRTEVSGKPGPPVENGDNSKEKKKMKISPLAKKLADRHNLDLGSLAGTGPGGRILKEDVERALQDLADNTGPGRSGNAGEIIDGKRVKQTLPLKGMRKAIAEHMMSSLATSAQVSASGEFMMDNMVRLRATLLRKEKELGVRISYTDLMIRALVKAVEHVPLANSSLIDDEIKIWEDINVSIAVAVGTGEADSGLVAPVLKKCTEKSLVRISADVKDLSARARSGQLTLGELEGGTITFSNVGMFGLGWTISTPILNKSQAIIIQPGGICQKPVVENGDIRTRWMMTMSITFDHRILDGGSVGQFFGKLKEICEEPDYLHL